MMLSAVSAYRTGSRVTTRQRLLLLLGGLCLIPNPALQLGNFRLQMVHVLLVAMLFCLGRQANRSFTAWLVLSLPAAACALTYLWLQAYPLETLKLCALWMLGTATLVPGAPDDAQDASYLLRGIAAGIVINLGVCIVQLLTIPSGEYPLVGWYGYGESAAVMVEGFRSDAGMFGVRVFGLFSEPSDMTASIGHWWLLMCALRLGIAGATLARFTSSRLCTAGLFAGAPLLMLARSGHNMVLAAGFLILLAASLRRAASARQRLVPAVIVVAVLVVALYDLHGRVGTAERIEAGHEIGAAWAARAGSIVESASRWTNGSASQFLFGLGYDGVERIRFDTGYNVWSVVMKSILTFGLPAALAWILLLTLVVREIRMSAAPLAGAVFAGVCVTASAVTTSYETLASPWLGFATLLCWSRIFGVRQAETLVSKWQAPVVAADPVPAAAAPGGGLPLQQN